MIKFCRNLGDLVVLGVFMAELSAVQTAVELIMRLDIPRIVIETDSLEVVRFLSSPLKGNHQFSDMVHSIKQMQEAHGAMVFNHTFKECNSLTDYLLQILRQFPLVPILLITCHSLLERGLLGVLSLTRR